MKPATPRWDSLRQELLRVCNGFHGGRSSLARYLGVNTNQTSNWINGHTAPCAESLLAMIQWLTENPISPNAKWMRLFGEVMKVTPHEFKIRGRKPLYPPSAYMQKKVKRISQIKPGDFYRKEKIEAAAKSIGCGYWELRMAVTGKLKNQTLLDSYRVFLCRSGEMGEPKL